MAKIVKKKVGRVKTKKKRWFPVFAPKFLGQKEIGESYLVEADKAVGRQMKINLRDLTGSIKDQNIAVSLEIKEVTGNNLQTEVVGYAYMPFYIKKLARRKAGKVSDSFISKTKDNKYVRMKPLVMTVFPINRSMKTSIRKETQKLLKEELGKDNFDGLVTGLLRYRLQAEFKKKLSKICPVREVIMRVVKIEKGKRVRELKVSTEDKLVAEKTTEKPKSKEKVELVVSKESVSKENKEE